MTRLIFSILLLTCALPAFAQSVELNQTRATLQQRLADAERGADEAERNERIREAADRIEDAQTAQAYDRFEGELNFFGILITILVLVFGFSTHNAAAAAAAIAAQKEVADAKGVIEKLTEEARTANAAAQAASAEAERLLLQARSQAELHSGRIREAAESAEASARRVADAEEKSRLGAEALARAWERSRAEAREAGQPQLVLTEEEAETVRIGAEATPEKPDERLSVDEFRSRIGKAAYIDGDHEAALRLASQMEAYHDNDEKAVSFALRAQGDALMELKRHERAIGVYSDLIARFIDNKEPEIVSDLHWARYNKGYLLGEMGAPRRSRD